jgi:type II secretory pathway pseudopilin PulG
MAANLHDHGPQSGMSLVALLVAIGILGVLSVVISQSFKFNLDASQKINDSAAAEDLRQHIRIQIDCAQTTASAPTPCSSKEEVALKRWGVGAKDLVQKTNLNKNTKTKSNSYTEVGDFSLRAYCVGNPKTYNVDYGRTPKNSNNQPDWKPLFKIPVVCP